MRVDDVDLLEGLVDAYGPTYQEAPAVDYLVGQMRALGFDAAVDAVGNAVGTRGAGEKEILLLGHIDTVPGRIPVRREGGQLYGRGSVDAKGPLACFTAAAARVSPPPDWRVTVVGAVAEEGDSRGALSLIGRQPPAALIIGEPSKWDRITLGFKGSLWAEYTVHKPVAHTAGREESACDNALGYWNAVRAWCAEVNAGAESQFAQLTPSLRGMGSSSDDFVETAWLKFNLRLPPQVSPDQAAAQLEACRGEGRLSFGDRIAAYRAEKNTPLVRAFLGAVRAEGGSPAFSLKTGTSDMNLVAPGWGCPAVAYGPGDSSLDHTPDEHVSIEEYRRSINVLARALEQLWAVSEG
ncbi:MAG TPA: [LysW]-lysine hydrolase [Anaerolineaceae bacterium]